MYEKWDHGVTTKNKHGRKVYKRFYTKSKAMEYMYSILSKGIWAVYWDKSQSPKFYNFTEMFKGTINNGQKK